MFPITLNLAGRRVLLIGGGRVGRRKLERLLAAGARVRLVEPQPAPELSAGAGESLEIFPEFQPELLFGVTLAFLATGNSDLNETLAQEARRAGIWVNVADRPDLSDFFLPALLAQGDFQLTVSTGGASPAWAAKTVRDLASRFGPEYGLLTRLFSRLRPEVTSSGASAEQRRRILQAWADSSPDLLTLLARDRLEEAEDAARDIMSREGLS